MPKNFLIEWAAPSDNGGSSVTSYDVGVTQVGVSGETVYDQATTVTSYTVTGLTDGEEYSVRVRAENSRGKGPWSSAVTQIAALAPEQVTGVSASAGDTTLDLSWTAPASDAAITDYSVEYTYVQPLTGVALLAPFDADLDDVLGITGTATNTPAITSGGKFGSYADIDVADKLVYSGINDGGGDWTVEFFIKRTQAALSGAGYENFANPVLTIPGVLRLVTTLSSTAISVQEDDFGSWAYTNPRIDTVAFDAEWHHIALVRDGSTLRCYLDGTQLGNFASSGSVTSLEFGASTVYGGVFGLDDLRVSTSAVYPSGTTFTPPTTAHPTSGGGGGTTATVLVGSAATSYQITGLTNDTEYSVRVAAVSAAGTGAYSTAVTGTPSAAVGWSLTSASYSQSITTIAGATNLTEVVFKPDGTRFYTVSQSSHNIDQYDLATAWDISSATHTQSFYYVGSAWPADSIAFKPDGTRLFTSGSGYVNDWALSTPWDISSLTHVRELNRWRTLEATKPNIAVRPDGSAIYVLGQQKDIVYEFAMATPWDVATTSYTREYSIQAQETQPTGLFFHPDGIKMFVCGETGLDVNEYDIASAWDITTAVYVQSYSVAAQSTSPYGLAFKDDGSKMYVADNAGQKIDEYSL